MSNAFERLSRPRQPIPAKRHNALEDRQEVGITVLYWSDLDAIKNLKTKVEHRKAQRLGCEKWYASFKIRITRFERDYGF